MALVKSKQKFKHTFPIIYEGLSKHHNMTGQKFIVLESILPVINANGIVGTDSSGKQIMQ